MGYTIRNDKVVKTKPLKLTKEDLKQTDKMKEVLKRAKTRNLFS